MLALEYLKVCALALVGGLLVGALDFAEVFDAFALREVFETSLLPSVSAIALRFGGILTLCRWSFTDLKRKRGEMRYLR